MEIASYFMRYIQSYKVYIFLICIDRPVEIDTYARLPVPPYHFKLVSQN